MRFEHDTFHNKLKEYVYGQVYSYKYCRLLPEQESITRLFHRDNFIIKNFKKFVSGGVTF